MNVVRSTEHTEWFLTRPWFHSVERRSFFDWEDDDMAVITGINSVISGEINNVRQLKAAGAPTTNVTGLGILAQGDQYVNTTNGTVYTVTATNGTSTIAFAVIGAQT